ncbi:hypothetical protein [Streptomyces collinus]
MTEQQQPRIPGVRYRKVVHEEYVPVTFNGETKLRKRKRAEYVPVPPVNLDRLYLRAVIAVAVFLTAVAVVWSTSAIGRLLGDLVPGQSWVGYLGAASFEVPWVTCLMVQWILRYQPERARAVGIAGWIGLGIVVGAIVTDGARLDMIEVGVIGAFVSVIAKGMWWVVLRLFHVPLDEDHAGWLNATRQELAVARVMLGEQQQMSGTEAYLTATLGYQPGTAGSLAVGQPLPAPELPAAVPAPAVEETPDPQPPAVPAAPPVPSAPPSVPSSAAVPAAPSAPAPAAAPSAPSVPASAQAPAPPVPPSVPSAPAPSAPAPQPSAPSAAPSVPAPQPTPIGAPTISGTVAALVAADPGLRDRKDELVKRAAKAHPAKYKEDPGKFRSTVLRNLRTKVETRRGRRAVG